MLLYLLLQLLLRDLGLFVNQVALFDVIEEALVLEVLLAPRAEELQNLKDYFDVAMQLDRWETALTWHSFYGRPTSPTETALDTVFTVKPVTLGALQGEGLYDVLAEPAAEEVD